MASSCQNEEVIVVASSVTCSALNAQSHLESVSEGNSSAAVSFSTADYGGQSSVLAFMDFSTFCFAFWKFYLAAIIPFQARS